MKSELQSITTLTSAKEQAKQLWNDLIALEMQCCTALEQLLILNGNLNYDERRELNALLKAKKSMLGVLQQHLEQLD